MFKLLFGIVIVGLILYIVYQIRKSSEKLANIQNARDQLSEVKDELDVIAVKNNVQDAKEKLHKRSTKLGKRVDELSEKQSNKE